MKELIDQIKENLVKSLKSKMYFITITRKERNTLHHWQLFPSSFEKADLYASLDEHRKLADKKLSEYKKKIKTGLRIKD